jgi:hypothetical protein
MAWSASRVRCPQTTSELLRWAHFSKPWNAGALPEEKLDGTAAL